MDIMSLKIILNCFKHLISTISPDYIIGPGDEIIIMLWVKLKLITFL